MRLVMLVPAFYPALDYGGPVEKVAQLATGLYERGHSIQVWTADFGLGRTRSNLSIFPYPFSVRQFRRIAAYKWSPLAPQALFAAQKLRHTGRPDVIHVFGIRDLLSPFAVAGLRGVPVIIEPSGMLAPKIHHQKLKRMFDRTIGQYMLRRATGYIATSGLEATEIQGLAPSNRCWVRYNPIKVDLSSRPKDLRSDFGIPPDAFVVGFVGRISKKKRIDELLSAVCKFSDVHLVIVGPDSGDGSLRQFMGLAETQGVDARVHVLGAHWGSSRDSLIKGFDITALLSENENFGNSIAESAALGTPVVVSPATGVSELIQTYDVGAVVSDVGSFVSLIGELRNDRSRLRAWHDNASGFRNQLSLLKVTERQEKIYEDALAVNGPTERQ